MGDWFNFVPNYTGPYISNGRFQSSVEFGNVKPKDRLDALSRLHDSAYAKWGDRLHRSVADTIYNEEATKLAGLFPELAANLVLYGNHTARSFSNLADRTTHFGGLGLVMGGLENMYDLYQYTTKKDSVKREILKYFKSDPYMQYQYGGSKNSGNMGNGHGVGNKTDYYDPTNGPAPTGTKTGVWGSEGEFKSQIPQTNTSTYDPNKNSYDYDTYTAGHYNDGLTLNDPFAYERAQIIFKKKSRKKNKKKKIFPF